MLKRGKNSGSCAYAAGAGNLCKHASAKSTTTVLRGGKRIQASGSRMSEVGNPVKSSGPGVGCKQHHFDGYEVLP